MRLRKKISYVSLDSSKFLTDEKFRIMKPDERGVYCTLIFALYTHGGYIDFNDDLSFLCNCSKEKFRKIWNKIKFKFNFKKSKIFHSKVIKELKIAAVRSQILTDKGIKGANRRWEKNAQALPKHSLSNANVNENVNVNEIENVNVNKNENENEKRSDVNVKISDVTNTNNSYSLDSNSTKSLSTNTNSFRQGRHYDFD
jgi:uncharacterized protein YdaU (DUF1376 family)